MEKLFIIKSQFWFLGFWTLATILIWFRPRIELLWKITATLLLGFNIFFFYEEVYKQAMSFSKTWYVSLLGFLNEIKTLLFINQYFFWPIVLIVAFYKADDMGAERLIKYMCIFSIVVWIIFIVFYYFDTGINSFIYENIKELLPPQKK